MSDVPHARSPIFLEVLSNYLLSAADEMSAAMVRSAYSPAIRDRHDCSAAILNAQGEVLAESADIPIHLGALVGVATDALQHYGVDRLRPGDVIIANDPYDGASTHLNDISITTPIFLDGELFGFTCVTAHHSDVGGMRPGSESADAETIFQEGLRIPAMKIAEDRTVLLEVLRLVGINSRTPEERAGDLRAQVGAVLRGSDRVQELAARYGVALLKEGTAEILDRTEARFRSALSQLPDGAFTATEHLDPARADGSEVQFHVTVRKDSDRIKVDFSGTSPQLAEGRNLPLRGTLAVVNYAMRSLVDPELPANSGFFRAVDVDVPEATLISPTDPAPASTRASTAQYLAATIYKALSDVWPERVVAGCDGRRKVIFSGFDSTCGRNYVYHESNAGGIGAHETGDAIDGAAAHVIQILNLPAEAMELAYPLRILKLELMTDSGGPGRHRGGAGVRRDYQVLSETGLCHLVAERSNEPLWGLAGGMAGAPGRFVLNPNTPTARVIDNRKQAQITLKSGDILSVQTAGGGGYGDPLQRSVDKVVTDVSEGRVSQESARRDYGVHVHEEDSVLRGTPTSARER